MLTHSEEPSRESCVKVTCRRRSVTDVGILSDIAQSGGPSIAANESIQMPPISAFLAPIGSTILAHPSGLRGDGVRPTQLALYQDGQGIHRKSARYPQGLLTSVLQDTVRCGTSERPSQAEAIESTHNQVSRRHAGSSGGAGGCLSSGLSTLVGVAPLILAACGSSSAAPSTTSGSSASKSSKASATAYTACLKQHGVTLPKLPRWIGRSPSRRRDASVFRFRRVSTWWGRLR